MINEQPAPQGAPEQREGSPSSSSLPKGPQEAAREAVARYLQSVFYIHPAADAGRYADAILSLVRASLLLSPAPAPGNMEVTGREEEGDGEPSASLRGASRLLSCPFCGSPCDHDIDGDPDDGYAVYITASHKDWCPFAMSNQTGADNGLSFDFDSDAEMIAFLANWNRRAGSPQAAPAAPEAQPKGSPSVPPVSEPGRLVWTREKPTEPGWYWCRFADAARAGDGKAFYEVRLNAYDAPVWETDDEWEPVADDLEWAGPVTIPEPTPATSIPAPSKGDV
jgi:hypothetical protein